MGGANKQQKHFVLVHGAGHGAWCWFKLKPLLEAAGHRVSAFDLAASGTDTRTIQQVQTFSDYTLPLLEFMVALPTGEKVVLVGHSLGGMNLAVAMEKFPEKVSVAVFLFAFMPDYVHKPSYVLDKHNENISTEDWLDTKFSGYDTENGSETSVLFGPHFLTSKLYNLCSNEDLELGKMLVRPSSLFLNDLRKERPFSKNGYGSVTRIYIIGMNDEGIPKEFQMWMIDNSPVTEVKELEDVDHMSMLSNPKQVCASLVDVALRYT
ncbi:salicylic acid-binding protein 2-like [Bidens hawaiensis]|uniref:salicylic acid-binding protein 2-like n=1 Tax=Bidens hawaiensis TaxID=980011 RepID=UPI00404AE0AB